MLLKNRNLEERRMHVAKTLQNVYRIAFLLFILVECDWILFRVRITSCTSLLFLLKNNTLIFIQKGNYSFCVFVYFSILFL